MKRILPLILALVLLAACGTAPAPTPTAEPTPTPEPTPEPALSLPDRSNFDVSSILYGHYRSKYYVGVSDDFCRDGLTDSEIGALLEQYDRLVPVAEHEDAFPEDLGSAYEVYSSDPVDFHWILFEEHPTYTAVCADDVWRFYECESCEDALSAVKKIYLDREPIERTDADIASVLAKVRGIAEDLNCENIDRIWYDPAIDAMVTREKFTGELTDSLTVLYRGTYICHDDAGYGETGEFKWVCWNGTQSQHVCEALTFTRENADAPWEEWAVISIILDGSSVANLSERNTDGIVEG